MKKTYASQGHTMRNEFKICGDICHIKLTQDKWTMINTEDIELTGNIRWCVSKSNHAYYATSKIDGKTMKLARFLLKTTVGMRADHIDHNTLDDRRSNIRSVTHWENSTNRLSSKNSTSVYLGVYLHKKRNKCWVASFKINSKKAYIGYFRSERQAGIARAKAFVKEYGKDLNPEQTVLSKFELLERCNSKHL